MSTGDRSGSTPPTPIASTASPVPPISPFLTPAAAAAGIRYPLYVQGLYSPAAAIFGQTVLPWRSIGTQLTGSSSPTTVTSNILQSPSSGTAASPQQTAAQQLVNVPNLTSITQLPSLVYPLTMPTVLTAQSGINSVSGAEAKKLSGPSITTLKRHSDGTVGDSDVKRPRLSDSSVTPHSPSLTSSSSSHPSTPTQLYKQPTHSQRSPVIKFIPYNPGQSVVLPSSSSQATPIVIPQNVNLTQQQQQQPPTAAALLAGASPTPKATPTALAAPPGAAQLQHTTYTIQHLPSTDSTIASSALHRLASGGSSSTGPAGVLGGGGGLMNKIGGGATAGSGEATMTNSALASSSFMSLPYGRHIVLLKCFGPLPDNLTTHTQLIITNLLVDLYRPSYFTLSNYSDQLALLPESCALLTICYLNSLRSGERISVENLRTMIHYAQLGETEWLHYHKKHKKMSESTFVQSQLMHFSRIVVYPVQGKVRLVVSNQSLSEGITDTLQNLSQILNSSESAKMTVPDYLVVMAIRPLSTIDFCILVLDPLQVQLLSELKQLSSHHESRTRRYHRQRSNERSHVVPSPGALRTLTLTTTNTGSHVNYLSCPSAVLSSSNLQIDRSILFSIQSFHKKLNGKVLLPYSSAELRNVELRSDVTVSRLTTTMSKSDAESMTPNAPHIIEHRPRGPFQDQYNVAMYMLQRILSSGAKSKMEDYQAVDFRILCPPDATFVSQTISEIVTSGVISHLTSAPTSSSTAASPQEGSFSFSTSMYSEAERRVICCSPKDSGRFHAFLKEVENNQSTLYVVIAENGHLTNSIAHSHSSSSESSNTGSTNNIACISDSQKLLCDFGNCILLYVSSHPYSLQSNRSLVSPSCEIHWPVNAQLVRDDTGLTFYSSSDHQSGLFKKSRLPEHMVRFCEDHSFEEMFQNALINNCISSSTFSEQILSLRANLLLNQYAAAMLVALGQPGRGDWASGGIPLPETQQLVNHLVLDPVSSPRGYGSMILIRSHDIKIGKQFYHKLKALRDALGLQFRFEVIFDDGSHLLSVSEHFMKRLTKWGASPTTITTHTTHTAATPPPATTATKTQTAAVSGAVSPSTEQPLDGAGEREGGGGSSRSRLRSDGSVKSFRSGGSPDSSTSQTVVGDAGRGGGSLHSYKQLEHLPCVVVLAGGSRAGLSFPSSLDYVDLRLCYPTGHITRTCYEYDTTFFNGYYQSQHKSSSSPVAAAKMETRSRGSDQTEAMDTSVVCDDSDSEVFEVSNSTPAGAVAHHPHHMHGNHTAVSDSHDQSSINTVRMNSSSSSSCDDRHSKASSHESPEPATLFDGSNSGHQHHMHHHQHHHHHHTVSGQTVEWRPTGKSEDGSSMMLRNSRMARKTPSDDLQSPQNNGIHDPTSTAAAHSGTVTVMIDPPNDEEQLFAESADNLGSRLVFRRPSTSEEEAIDLFADLDDSDSEGEEAEGTALMKTCLLSRPYYHIWTSSNPQQNLLLLPAQGVTWYGGHKRPPLFDPDPQQQSMHYRKWTKPLSKEVRGQLDGILRVTNRSSRRSFLLSGPPQVGKTGAWLLMVRLLHSHLHSSQGVTVKNPPAPRSIFVSPGNFKEETWHHLRSEEGVISLPQLSPTLALRPSKQSRVVSLECLERIAQLLALDARNDSKPPKLVALNNSPSKTVAKPTQLSSPPLTHHTGAAAAAGRGIGYVHVQTDTAPAPSTTTISLPLSPYMTYDFTHSCSECSKHMRGNTIAQPEYLSSSLPMATGNNGADSAGSSQGYITIKWFVPASQQKHCVVSQDRKVLERLKLPTFKFKGEKASQPVTPIFTPTVGRDSSGLFNLFHSSPHHFHVLVTNFSEFKAYCKAWPNHIIMALPDQEAVGLGSTYHLLKQFVQYNYSLNVQSNTSLRVVWPLVAFTSDSIVMWKKLHPSGRTTDVSLSEVLLVMEQSPDSFDLVAMSAVPWSKQLEDGGNGTTGEELTNYDLSHDFILLNLSKISSLTYNRFSLNSAQVGFNLQLQAIEMKTKLFKDFAFVQKHLPSGGNPYPCQGRNSTLVADIDKAVISLHHDSSSHLPYPGPYLMEHFLLYKSQVLFPYAQSPEFPVLIVDNYISLGPHTHVTFIQSMSLTSLELQNSAVLTYKLDTLSKIRFSGLVLYLCEGKLSSEQLSRLNFVQGACLCLVTRDCKTLVREVARLDLEERWKFRLRDEYQTACADSMRPLFFLTGRFEG